MNTKNTMVWAIGLLVSLGLTVTASATPLIYSLDVYSKNLAPGEPPHIGPYGTVSLEQIGPDVQVVVTPGPGDAFIRIPLSSRFQGYSLAFNLNGKDNIVFHDITPGFFFNNGFINTPGGPAYQSGNGRLFITSSTDPGARFDLDIFWDDLTTNFDGPLSFIANNVAVSDFTVQPGSVSRFITYLCIDKFGPGVDDCTAKANVTVEKSQVPTLAAVPEPATIALLGAGLAGIAGMRRRRKAGKN